MKTGRKTRGEGGSQLRQCSLAAAATARRASPNSQKGGTSAAMVPRNCDHPILAANTQQGWRSCSVRSSQLRPATPRTQKLHIFLHFFNLLLLLAFTFHSNPSLILIHFFFPNSSLLLHAFHFLASLCLSLTSSCCLLFFIFFMVGAWLKCSCFLIHFFSSTSFHPSKSWLHFLCFFFSSSKFTSQAYKHKITILAKALNYYKIRQ